MPLCGNGLWMLNKNRDFEFEANHLHIRNIKYQLLSLLSSSTVGILALWAAQTLGVDVRFWWGAVAGIMIVAGFELAAYFAKKRSGRFATELDANSMGLQRARYIAAYAKFYAINFRWFFFLALLAPIGSGAFHIKPQTYLMICFLSLIAFSDSIAVKRASLETGYVPPTKKRT
jgi:hypothetical protein